MNEYLSTVNAPELYLLVAIVLAVMTAVCFLFLIKSYRAGVKLGMDKKVLRRAITSSATFTLLPSISILLGVIALSGSLGVPLSWLRLSVIGSLQYELNVAEIAAQSVGIGGLQVQNLTPEAFTTIALVMTVGILGGIICCIFFLKGYLGKLKTKPKAEEKKDAKPGFGAHATTALFVGLCATFVGSYVGRAVHADWMPLAVALIAGLVMGIFEFFIRKRSKVWLENFSLAASMLAAMAAAVILGLMA